jgi:hypothetical protein
MTYCPYVEHQNFRVDCAVIIIENQLHYALFKGVWLFEQDFRSDGEGQKLVHIQLHFLFISKNYLEVVNEINFHLPTV